MFQGGQQGGSPYGDPEGEQDGIEERELEDEQKVGGEVKEPKDDHPSALWGRPSHVFLLWGRGVNTGCLSLSVWAAATD